MLSEEPMTEIQARQWVLSPYNLLFGRLRDYLSLGGFSTFCFLVYVHSCQSAHAIASAYYEERGKTFSRLPLN